MTSLPDDDMLVNWRKNYTTKKIWDYIREHFEQPQAWRNCDPEKLEYWRGRADLYDEFAKIFQIRDNN